MPRRALCAASCSFITGHDGLHQLTLPSSRWSPLFLSLQPSDIPVNTRVHLRYLTFTKVWDCGAEYLSATITGVAHSSGIHPTLTCVIKPQPQAYKLTFSEQWRFMGCVSLEHYSPPCGAVVTLWCVRIYFSSTTPCSQTFGISPIFWALELLSELLYFQWYISALRLDFQMEASEQNLHLQLLLISMLVLGHATFKSFGAKNTPRSHTDYCRLKK